MRLNTVTTAATYGMLAFAGCASFLLPDSILIKSAYASATDVPPMLQLIGVVRDFKERTVAGGHTDMEQSVSGNYAGNIAEQISEDRKPVYTGAGRKLNPMYKDATGLPICHLLYDSSRGDVEGVWTTTTTGGIESAASFDQWYRDVPGVNLSAPLALTLHLQGDGSYVFDSASDSFYAARGGFFPIDELLYGNSPGTPNHNFHFTFEAHSEFTYDADANQVFTFAGDDDVWVYINGKLVIDLGGIHSKLTQTVALDRLGLEDGETYPLDLFFAERHRTQSNFRIQTNLVMTPTMLPTITMACD